MGLFTQTKKEERSPARTVIEDVVKAKKDEKVLIIANPETNIIAQDLYTAAVEAECRTVLVYQGKKSIMDNTEDAVTGAIKSEPDIILSISAGKLGKDREAIKNPYKDEKGSEYTSAFDYLIYGKKCTRAVWMPGVTADMFNKTVNIDYKLLADRCRKLSRRLENAVSIHVTSPNGTDITVPVEGRVCMCDDGDYSLAGSGGNIPSGEIFISPQTGKSKKAETNGESALDKIKDKVSGLHLKELVEDFTGSKKEEVEDNAEKIEETSEPAENNKTVSGCTGVIVFDGSMSFADGSALLDTPITCRVEDGFVTEITGGEEAKRLVKDIGQAEREPFTMEESGQLPKGQGEVYARNARNIGELGIGLNPNASITGNMLEDEKAFHTCHFAIGQNYDGDAPALIHLDGLVRNPTITVSYADDKDFIVLDKGELKI